MNKQEIKIKGVNYPLHGGMSTLRLYCMDRGFKSITEGFKVFNADVNDLSIEMMDSMAAFVLAGVKEGCRKNEMEKPALTIEDIIDLFDEDMNVIIKSMEFLTDRISEMYGEKPGEVGEGKKEKPSPSAGMK